MHRKMVTSWSYLVITIVTILFLFFFYFEKKKHYSHFCVCKDCLLSGKEVRTLRRRRTLDTCKCCLCVFVCKYVYTKHWDMFGKKKKKKSYVVHFLWPKKGQIQKKKHPIKVSFISILFFSYGFMVLVILWLWVLFTWYVTRLRSVKTKKKKKGKK